ncbi:UNVERIFIED_CONTAM: hypothetical protein Slati_1043900, partial [Sesamum latifolium]
MDTQESCFKLTGYPDRYKNLLDQRRNTGGPANRANNVDTKGTSQGSVTAIGPDFSDIIRMEIRRAMQEHNHAQDHDTNLVDFEDFA